MSLAGFVGSLWFGECCCHSPAPCIPMSGYIIDGSPDIFTNVGTDGLPVPQGRVGDLVIGDCGHTGNVISGSVDIFGDIGTDGKVIPKAYVGSLVFGYNYCGSGYAPLTGLVIEGDPRHFLDPPEEE